MAFEPVPAALIHQLQRSLCQDSSLPISSPELPSIPSSLIASIEDATASLDPSSLDPSVRCGRCRGGLLSGRESAFCIYCGEEFNGGEGRAREISFGNTVACSWLLGSLGLDQSDPVSFGSESNEPNKGRGPPRTGTVLLSDVLDLKLALSPNKTNRIQTGIKNEPISTPYTLNLSGVDLDSIFKETKKEIPSTKVTPGIKNQTFVDTKGNMMNLVKAESSHSFAKWEADFQPNSNDTESSSVTKRDDGIKIGDSNDSFDVSEYFTVSSGAQSGSLDPSKTIEPASMETLPINHSEPLDPVEKLSVDGDDFVDWQNFAGSVVTQNGSNDSLPVENINQSYNIEALNAEFDDAEDFTLEKAGPGSVDNKDTLNANDDNSFDDWKDFTGSNAIQSELPAPVEKTRSVSFDPFPTVSSDSSKELIINGDELFDDWKDFSGSGIAQSRLMGEKTESASVDPLNQEALNVEFDDWKDLTGSNVGQSRLSAPGEKIEPVESNPVPIKSIEPSDDLFEDWQDFATSSQITENPSNQIDTSIGQGSAATNEGLVNSEAINGSMDLSDEWLGLASPTELIERASNKKEDISNSTDAWLDFTGSVQLKPNSIPNEDKSNLNNTMKSEENNEADLFDDWQDFTGSSDLKKAESNSNDGNLNSKGNSLSDDWLHFTTGSSQIKGNITKSAQANNDTSDDLLDFTSTVWNNEGNKFEEIKKQNDDASDNWQDFTSAGQAPSLSNIVSLNGGIQMNGADPLAALSAPSGVTLSGSKSLPEPINDVEKFLSQMNDISFMLKDDLSVPNKLNLN